MAGQSHFARQQALTRLWAVVPVSGSLMNFMLYFFNLTAGCANISLELASAGWQHTSGCHKIFLTVVHKLGMITGKLAMVSHELKVQHARGFCCGLLVIRMTEVS